jgi:hypothetical protein
MQRPAPRPLMLVPHLRLPTALHAAAIRLPGSRPRVRTRLISSLRCRPRIGMGLQPTAARQHDKVERTAQRRLPKARCTQHAGALRSDMPGFAERSLVTRKAAFSKSWRGIERRALYATDIRKATRGASKNPHFRCVMSLFPTFCHWTERSARTKLWCKLSRGAIC